MARTKAAKRKEKREKRKAEVHAERVAAKKRRRTKLLLNWSIVAIAAFLLLFVTMSLADNPSKYEKFAKCLSKEGATIYGTDWCSYCQAQKRLFGRAFKEVDYVNCDYSQRCTLDGIKGFPTWRFADGSEQSGVLTMEELAEKTGCELPE